MQTDVPRWRGSPRPPTGQPATRAAHVVGIAETIVTVAALFSAGAAAVQAYFAWHVGSYADSADRLARANLEVARTNLDLVRASIEPAFEAGVSMGNELVVENAGRDPILDVIVSRAIVTVTNGKICGARTGVIPAAPGEKREWFWTIPRLNAGERLSKPLMPLLEEGLHAAKDVRYFASQGGLTCDSSRNPFVFPVVALKIAYKREADGRRFTRVIRFVASQAGNTGTIIAEQGGMYFENFRQAIDAVNPAW